MLRLALAVLIVTPILLNVAACAPFRPQEASEQGEFTWLARMADRDSDGQERFVGDAPLRQHVIALLEEHEIRYKIEESSGFMIYVRPSDFDRAGEILKEDSKASNYSRGIIWHPKSTGFHRGPIIT